MTNTGDHHESSRQDALAHPAAPDTRTPIVFDTNPPPGPPFLLRRWSSVRRWSNGVRAGDRCGGVGSAAGGPTSAGVRERARAHRRASWAPRATFAAGVHRGVRVSRVVVMAISHHPTAPAADHDCGTHSDHARTRPMDGPHTPTDRPGSRHTRRPATDHQRRMDGARARARLRALSLASFDGHTRARRTETRAACRRRGTSEWKRNRCTLDDLSSLVYTGILMLTTPQDRANERGPESGRRSGAPLREQLLAAMPAGDRPEWSQRRGCRPWLGLGVYMCVSPKNF